MLSLVTAFSQELVPVFSYRKSDQPEGVELFKLITKGDL